MWTVEWHADAVEELMRLPKDEQAALDHAVEKLAALGPRLPYQHQSAVQGQGV
jgi:mRNA-degrading endonuclease RelE of RelBE toxin-antitoxin system